MDPNAALGEIRACMANAFRKDDEIDVGEADNALRVFEGLDEWLTKGGFLPDPWRHEQQVRPDGSVVVTETVVNILAALAADLDHDLDNIRDGKGDPLASIENTAANLRLLASGTWGQGTAINGT